MVRCNICGDEKNPLEIIHPPVEAKEILEVVESENGEYAIFHTKDKAYRSWRVCPGCLKSIRKTSRKGVLALPFELREVNEHGEKGADSCHVARKRLDHCPSIGIGAGV